MFCLDDSKLGNVHYYEDTLKALAPQYSSLTEFLYIELYLNKRTTSVCAKKVGVTDRTILAWARRLGLPRKNKGGRNDDPNKTYWSIWACVRDPAHVIDGRTLRYKKVYGRDKHGKCVRCAKEFWKKRGKR